LGGEHDVPPKEVKRCADIHIFRKAYLWNIPCLMPWNGLSVDNNTFANIFDRPITTVNEILHSIVGHLIQTSSLGKIGKTSLQFKLFRMFYFQCAILKVLHLYVVSKVVAVSLLNNT